MKRNYWSIVMGMVWTVLFAGMSFYWAMGGLLGVRSLGGSIYEMSLNPEPSFIVIIWLTGVFKLFGFVLLLMVLIKWHNITITKILYYLTKIAGVALFLYGLLNFITITLSAFDVLDFDLDSYATFWRLVFWEPFWMLGGIFYFFSVRK
ncbi:DUF3995 domain-containing protein [Gracilibacillus salitolerans]|uniref:DUF3995 domain-containing protein n=1 Tax=Gracilibacillus salitolerans TaxID=2663022 RepID=A0A5Q2TE24_9BACI|nr:DUF3995 domain-containing protein [Gracilibacillus salitolerans]QGH32876.1 DUF3995 domain-containing protein [Gracilibacillus salitolerans]